MLVLELVMRILHIFGATLLVGAVAVMLLSLWPVIARMEEQPRRELFDAVRPRWAMLVGIGTGLLLISGLYNTAMISIKYQLDPSYHLLLGVKIVLGLVVFVLAALVSGRSGLAKKMQAKLSTWLAVTLLLAVATLAVGAHMKSLDRKSKPKDSATLSSIRGWTFDVGCSKFSVLRPILPAQTSQLESPHPARG
jgi:uncharacterized membrane protein